MTQNQNRHDLETFQDVLLDHFTGQGIQIPIVFRRRILRKLFRPGDSLHAVCAVQYGSRILLVPNEEGKASVHAILCLDIHRKRLNQFISE